MLFKVVTSRKAIAVQEVMQNSQNVKNSLPTEYLCRILRKLQLDKKQTYTLTTSLLVQQMLHDCCMT